MARGLYIHIPFCKDICSYCDFCKVFYNEKICSLYLDALEKEINNKVNKEIDSIYVGGGTPSSLSLKNLNRLLDIISPFYKEGISYAFEANFDSLDEEKIDLLIKYHVNRISLGVQSFKDEILLDMKRHHNKDEVFKKIEMIRSKGIKDINIDLIYGYHNQSFDDVKNDVKIAITLPITHISTYALMVNDNTYLKLRKIEEKDEEIVSEEYEYIVNELKKNGFSRYEVSNFSKEGYESKHNLIYWRNEEYYGVGAGASSYIDGIRSDNTRSLTSYLKGKTIYNEEILTKDDEEFYFIMLGLRLKEGISLTRYKENFNKDFKKAYEGKYEKLKEENLLIEENDNIKVIEKYLFILDFILKRLLY